MTNSIICNYGQGGATILTLPAAAASYDFIAVVGTAGAGAFSIKAGAGDKIYLYGTALDDGDKVTLATPVVGNSASFFAFKTGASAWDWFCLPIFGTWSDGGQ